MKEYLNRVLVYLKQELPAPYKDLIELDNDKFTVNLPADENFEAAYTLLFDAISTNINRVRTRDYDLEFTVTSKYQGRDFKIIK